MLEEFTVSNFKRYSQISIGNLSHINIFVGMNNVGKTSMLEAIMAYACGQKLPSIFSMAMLHRTYDIGWQSGNSPYSLAEMIFNLFYQNNEIDDFMFDFSGSVDGRRINIRHIFKPSNIFSSFIPNASGVFEDNQLNIEQPKNQSANMVGTNIWPEYYLGAWEILQDDKEKRKYDIILSKMFQENNIEPPLILARLNEISSHKNENENRMIYSVLARGGYIPEVIDGLNNSFDNLYLKNIENIPYPDGSSAPISLRLKNNKVFPMHSFGDGVRRWFNIIGGMAVYKNAIHCIEEMDATFNHRAQGKLSPLLCKYAKIFNNQLFITTHNAEFLHEFLSSVKQQGRDFVSLKEDVRVITLRNFNGTIRERVLDGSHAFEALMEGLELRL